MNKQIKNIIVDNNFSITGNSFSINLNTKGISLTIKSLSNIRQLSNLDKIKNIIEYFDIFFSQLNLSSNVNFKILLGDIKSKEYNNYLKEKVENTVSMINNYHLSIFPIRKRCYQKFNTVYLDGEPLDKPVYDHTGVTGRTSIKKGFNFLTLKKDIRKNLKPANKSNVLVEVDFKSCEPFFYLKSIGINIDERDVYQWISKKYEINFKRRDKIKQGLLSMIYGANEKTVSRLMGININKIKQIKEDIGIYNLESRIKKNFDKDGFFLNYYGRPITSDNNIVNYWIQSSAVDFCSLAFDNFCNENNVVPSYFIHDSMTFEIKKDRYKEIKQIKDIRDPISNISIPVEFNVIAE